jgi:hypothetical protein
VRTFLAAARWAVRRPIRAAGPYLLTVLASAAITFLGAAVASGLGGRPGLAALALVIVHQSIALLRTFLRAAWLGKAADLAVAAAAVTSPSGSTYADATPAAI